ncbi:phosphate system positive regulatory protein pho81, partial [Dimargaris xerosporica]
MKFGKYILSHQFLEWSGQYMNYKALKKIIGGLSSISSSTNQDRFQSIKTAFFFQLERELEK